MNRTVLKHEDKTWSEKPAHELKINKSCDRDVIRDVYPRCMYEWLVIFVWLKLAVFAWKCSAKISPNVCVNYKVHYTFWDLMLMPWRMVINVQMNESFLNPCATIHPPFCRHLIIGGLISSGIQLEIIKWVVWDIISFHTEVFCLLHRWTLCDRQQIEHHVFSITRQ